MTALARTWRPKTFENYVGQNHVKQSIINALNNNRLHHAYLFSGTRGVGKTTIARIFAKALSCKLSKQAEPCNNCSNCKEIDNGTFIDLIEVDAASKTKVEDTRDLLDHTQFVPHSSKFKIFIIDEVHMLSNHSFNALLKTLEEPPEHIKFFLATTEPNKLPVTVISRCLHFKLLPITKLEISQHLVKILSSEKINYEQNAIDLIADSANGSLRDALSNTDQMIALTNAEITTDSVHKLLGLIDHNSIKNLVSYILEGNKKETITAIENMYSNGICLKKVLWQIMTILHELLYDLFLSNSSTWTENCPKWQGYPTPKKKETIQYWYQIATFGIRDFDYAPNSLVAMNICIIRMLDFRSDPMVKNEQSPVAKQESILNKLDLKGMTKAIVNNLTIVEHTAEKIILTITNDKKALLTAGNIQKIKQAIEMTGYNGEVFIVSDTNKSKSELSRAFNGKLITSSCQSEQE